MSAFEEELLGRLVRGRLLDNPVAAIGKPAEAIEDAARAIANEYMTWKRELLAEVQRKAKEEALIDAQAAIVEAENSYKETAERLAYEHQYQDSRRYWGYSSGVYVAEEIVRKQLAAYRSKEESND